MFHDGFPINLRDDVTKIVKLISQKTNNNVTIGVSEDTVEYFQDNNVIKFPYRTYYIDNSDEFIDSLNEQQKMIVHCIYSRSCDGFVRQKHMNSLLLMDYEDWSIPYIVKICDEYVLEILEMTYEILKDQDTERIKKFCLQNNDSFCKSYNRMISYWNEYYRFKYNKFQQYIGRKLFRDCFGYSKSMERRKNRSL
ncbi:hypothetical protein CEY16_03200 [Halalkalibacillus sediminis]|uniref:Uncharacterized protein n=1 Tax=Halalkalibacillus sediminis TaxID=2018042 RepID=A0A2I0QWT8_9BACI|nr:hypothetical protein CEY16_03200 [Halalkalibacillus sediminis]